MENNIRCDHSQCPMKSKCLNYKERIDKTKPHWGSYPYEIFKGKCFRDIETPEDYADKIIEVIKPLPNEY